MRLSIRIICLFVFFTISKNSYCQLPLISDKVEDKVVIGFPGVTAIQLNQIKSQFLNFDQIVSAKFIDGNHNCMLIVFDQNGTDFSVYGEMLKKISQIYEVENCYFKPKSAFAEILGNIGNATIFEVK